MLSSLLRPRRPRKRIDRSPFSSPFTGSPQDTRRDQPERGRPPHTDAEDEEEQGDDYEEDEHVYEDLDESSEDSQPLLPIFSAAHLDTIPVYTITHAIRMLIVQRCETTLSWDQLRAPQVSQFLVKPIQTQIRANHFNRATLTALIANCLQFKKEAELNPGNAGVSRTRAILAELLAMRLLREYTTRELIDALSYDFDPLQGTGEPQEGKGKRVVKPRSARISTVEIAIRATAKSFLAHPLVVQQLEAIWAGSIVFHSAADDLHRKNPAKALQAKLPTQRGYGTIREQSPASPGTRPNGHAQGLMPVQSASAFGRRTVTLYDPRDASLFKLSRLRVPRYRQLFTTLSFAVMLVLYLAVLVERSRRITTLEIIFWIYSTGYMLDEIVGFSEQGFGLYLLSVWNAFDLGILLCLCIYYALRIYGVLMPDQEQRRIADMAYDVLASTAVLLFPRAFSVLDHYRYFSQLLIAFRLMAQDMVAILILIIISCSGFFVAFTTAYSKEEERGAHVAYAIFQIVMGFSPAAWSAWERYNILGRVVMAFFLVVCHFMIVTILITVLTNSFMAIVRNAEEEHQFLFAVNTISMVKSDALFSYVAPTNVLSWAVSPLRFIMPFRQFVKLNRTIIKVTHFPILFSIFAYERIILSRIAYVPEDLVDKNQPTRAKPMALQRPAVFASRSRRLREPSVVSFRKEQALDEVFRRPFRGDTVRTTAREMETDRPRSRNVVDSWMQNVGQEGGASPPMEQPRSILDRLESRRPGVRRAMTSDRMRTRRENSTAARSIMSDPEERAFLASRRPKMIEEETNPDLSFESVPQETDADDGDDELMTHDEAELGTAERSSIAQATTPDERATANKENVPLSQSPDAYFASPEAQKAQDSALPGGKPRGPTATMPGDKTKRAHDRTVSTNTILFQPTASRTSSSTSSSSSGARRAARPSRLDTSKLPTAESSGIRTPRQSLPVLQPSSRARPITSPRGPGLTPRPALAGFTFAPTGFSSRARAREPSFNTIALDLASDLGDNRLNPAMLDDSGLSGMPASFSEQMLREREAARRARDEANRRSDQAERGAAVQRLVLTRMNTLEVGFREVISAVRELKGREMGRSSGGPSSVVTSAAASIIDTRVANGPNAPETPGGGGGGGGKQGSKLRSPKKLKRPTLGSGPLSSSTTLRTALGATPLPEDAATYSEEAGERRRVLSPAGVGSEYPGPTDAVVDPAPPSGETPAKGGNDKKDKDKDKDKGGGALDTSPNSVKNMVMSLEQKGKLHVQAARRSASASSSQENRGASPTPAAGADADAADERGPTVGSRRARSGSESEGMGNKRETVIFVGKGPDLKSGRTAG